MNKSNISFGFKPIEEFSFDECCAHIEQNNIDGVENDSELLERYNTLLAQLQQKDDALYRGATDKAALQRYLAAYPLDTTATKYKLRHTSEASQIIAQIVSNAKKQRKKAGIITLIVLVVIAAVVCLLNYQPVSTLEGVDSLSISKYGDTITVNVNTNVPKHLLSMEVEKGSNWLHVSGSDGQYVFAAAPNATAARTAAIKISAPNMLFGWTINHETKTIAIAQESGEPTYIRAESSSMRFDKYGKPLAKSALTISTDGVLESVKSAPDWCNVEFRHISGDTYQCHVTMDKNPGAQKSGQITLSGGNISQTISIYQESGLATRISLDKSSISVSPQQATQYVSVRTDGTTWSIASKPSWVTATDCGNNSLKLEISENDNDKRTGTVVIKSNNNHTASLTVSQATSRASYIRVGSSSITAGVSGLSKRISVSTDGKSWSVYESPHWLTVTPDFDRNEINVRIPSNSGSVKDGKIILASNNGHRVTISVKQDGDPTNFQARRSTIQFDTDSDYEYVTIDNNSNQSLRVETSQSWITVRATSKGQIKISVPSNSGSPKSGYVTVRCGSKSCSITVKQKGWTDCSFCQGRGKVTCGYPALWMNGMHCVQKFAMDYYTGYGYYYYDPCPHCGGSGYVDCSRCHGRGRFKSN